MVIFTIAAAAILASLIAVGARPAAKRCFADTYFGRDSTSALRGLMVMTIIIHHISQQIEIGDMKYVFNTLGYPSVAIFFFLSGYGLMKRHMTDASYRKKFLLKRLTPLVIPYLFTALIYIAYGYISGNPYTLGDIIESYKKGDPFILFSWYFNVIVAAYLLFYLLMCVFRKHYAVITVLTFAASAGHIVLCREMHFGAWWYNTFHLFPIGMLWALTAGKAVKAMKKRFVPITLTLAAVLALSSYIRHSAYTDKNWDKYILLAAVNAVITTAVMMMMLTKLRLGSKALTTLSDSSLELYLIQGMFIVNMRNYITDDLAYSAAALICTLITGVLMHRIAAALVKRIIPRRK